MMFFYFMLLILTIVNTHHYGLQLRLVIHSNILLLAYAF